MAVEASPASVRSFEDDMTLTRKRRKPRLGGTACVGGKRCIATHEYNGRRYCAFHLADVKFAHMVRTSLEGQCWLQFVAKPLCNGNLQCGHIISRRYRAVRWAADNAKPLCGAHHVYFTHHPLEWEDICRRLGVDWDDLRTRALTGRPMDPEEVIECWREWHLPQPLLRDRRTRPCRRSVRIHLCRTSRKRPSLHNRPCSTLARCPPMDRCPRLLDCCLRRPWGTPQRRGIAGGTHLNESRRDDAVGLGDERLGVAADAERSGCTDRQGGAMGRWDRYDRSLDVDRHA